MEELRKINRILEKEYPDAFRETLVVLDATTGQNALAQAREFADVADITGIILTKMASNSFCQPFLRTSIEFVNTTRFILDKPRILLFGL